MSIKHITGLKPVIDIGFLKVEGYEIDDYNKKISWEKTGKYNTHRVIVHQYIDNHTIRYSRLSKRLSNDFREAVGIQEEWGYNLQDSILYNASVNNIYDYRYRCSDKCSEKEKWIKLFSMMDKLYSTCFKNEFRFDTR